MSGEERSGRRASRIRGAGKKLEFSREVVGEQEREGPQWPAIVSLRRTAASEIQNLNEGGQGQSPAVGNNGVTH